VVEEEVDVVPIRTKVDVVVEEEVEEE